MTSPVPDFLRIIRVLLKHEVDFVIVGGVAAVIQGVPVTTADLDIVHRRTEANARRLLAALDELAAVSRLDPRKLRPGLTHLLSAGHQLLTTNAGLLDVLGQISGQQGYEALIGEAEAIDIEGQAVHVLTLEQLIAAKTLAGRARSAEQFEIAAPTPFLAAICGPILLERGCGPSSVGSVPHLAAMNAGSAGASNHSALKDHAVLPLIRHTLEERDRKP